MKTMKTVDFIGGKVKIAKADGYDAPSSDAVFLAAATPVKENAQVLDVGQGCGILGILLAWRQPSIRVTGLEIDPELCKAAMLNFKLNKADGLSKNADITKCKIRETFDCVITNPPFFSEAPLSPVPQRGLARTQTVPLKTWLDFCLKRVKPKGNFAMLHKPAALPEILAAFIAHKMGAAQIIPIFSKAGQPANRIIVRAIKGSGQAVQILPGIVVHDGKAMTKAADAVLRDGGTLFL